MSGVNNPADLYPELERAAVLYQQNPNATTISLSGSSTPAIVTGTASLLQDSTGEYINYASAAGSGSVMAVQPQFVEFYGQDNPVFVATMKTGGGVNDLTAIRLWFGFFSANPTGVNTLGAIQGVAFRYATPVDGTAFWRCVTSDGSSATTTTTTVAVTLDTRYVFRVDWSVSGRVTFYINDQAVATHTTNLPALTTVLGWTCGGATTAAGAKAFRWRRNAYEMN